MNHRKLRIAWSVAWGMVAVLLIGLWVRSYGGTGNQVYKLHLLGRGAWIYCHSGSASIEWMTVRDTSRGLDWTWWGNRDVPHVFVIAVFSVLTIDALPWASVAKRFSLRTLLIAATLVACGLGLMVSLR